MFNLSGSEIIVILLLALVVLGPEKLPDAVRRAGRTYAELKRMGNSFQDEVRSALDEPVREIRETADLLRESTDFTDRTKPVQPSKPAPPPSSDVGPAEPSPAVDDPETALINRTLAGGSDPPSTADTNATS